jgi:hypothetical protein
MRSVLRCRTSIRQPHNKCLLSEVEQGDDPHVIARAVYENPRIINAIRLGIAEFYEMEERNKEIADRNGGRMICGAPTKAEVIRAKIVEDIESTEY